MVLFLLSYLGGVLTIVSPCILPVLPFVFTRADQPFVRSGLPLLIGMAITFAGVATLAAVGGGWAVEANQYGRIAALLLLALFGTALLFPAIGDRLARPLVAAGARLSQAAQEGNRPGSTIWPSFLLGIATGLLWAPCAGPILGLVLTGAALQGANIWTTLLLFSFAAGAATALAAALLVGGRVFSAMKHSLGAGEWIRRGLGIAVLGGVVAIALGLDTGLLAQISLASTSTFEQALLDKIQPQQPASVVMSGSGNVMMGGPKVMTGGPSMMMSGKPAMQATNDLPVEGQLPSLSGAVAWLNSPPLSTEDLRGKVVLVDFWTYSCINCLRSLPYIRSWAEKYKDQGLVVIGVHAPEFAFEKSIDNVRRATKDLKIDYPIAIDNDYVIWRAFNNQYWPAHYFIDAAGRIRHHHFGEGEYDHSEQVIQQLLAETGRNVVPAGFVTVDASGAGVAPDMDNVKSPETYIGYERAANFISPGGAVRDVRRVYSVPSPPQLNQWGLEGDWTVEGERAVLNGASGHIVYRFHARDLHLVLGPSQTGEPVRFRVLIDGKAPGNDHGADVDGQGQGSVTANRLYQLIRQGNGVTDRTFDIEFLGPGVQAFAFTFG
jgi:cytochrome c biogenesis protein CcdA/thiol-disulfide isomerase/thioredoxin